MEEEEPGLLFVNKTQTSASLSRSGGDEKYQIHSHVQSKRRKDQRKRKLETDAPRPWESYTSLIKPPRQGGVPIAGSSASKEASGSSSRTPEAQRSPPGCPPPPPAQDSPLTQEQVDKFFSSLSRVYPSQNCSDPFYTTAAGLELDAAHHAMLYYMFKYTARRNFLSESFAPKSVVAQRQEMRHSQSMNERLRSGITHASLLYSTLAYASGCLAWMDGIVLDSRPPEYFIAKALPALRNHLEQFGPGNPPDKWSLFSLYSLSLSAMWDSIPRLWASHCPERCRYLQSLPASDPEGGPQSVGARVHLVESIIMEGKYLTSIDGEAPIIHHSVFDPGVMTIDMLQKLGLREALYPNLGTSLSKALVCSDLFELVEHVVDFVRIAEHAWSSLPSVPSDIESWLFLRLNALLYRLLMLDDAGLSPLEIVVRLGAVVFLFSCVENLGSQTAASGPANQSLQRALEDCMPHADDGIAARVCLWALCTGGMVPLLPLSEREWYVRSIADFIPSLRVEPSEGSLEAELRGFLFLPSRQGLQLSRLADDLGSLGVS